MASDGRSGICLIALAAVTNVSNLALHDATRNLQLPYYRMTGAACLALGFIFAGSWSSSSGKGPSRRQATFVALRGLFGGALTFAFMLLAQQVGVPLGDIGALNSVNVVIAACIGQAFLGESTTLLHALGVALAVAGGVLIAQPSFIFGSSARDGGEGLWLGYLLAVASAACQALNFTFGRQARGVSTRLLTAASLFARGSALWLMVPTGVVDDYQLRALQDAPGEFCAWFAALAASMFVAMTASSAGSKRCPVAVSSVVYTAVNMASGYSADTLLFGTPPQLLTTVGAVLMLLAVVATAVAKRRVDGQARSKDEAKAPAAPRDLDEDACHACEEGTAGCGCGPFEPQHACVKATIFRHFYSDDATPEGLAARTLELTRSATVIKLTPDPYFMTLSFGGRAAPRERNDVRPALAVAPVPPEAGAWQDFGLRDRTHIDRVLATVRLLKASPEASGKPLYVNVFAPFTVAMQCDGRLVERLADASERPAVARGLAAIASATAEYIRELAAAGADGVFYANKCMRHELGALVDEWVVPMDMLALAPLRAGQDGEEGGGAGDQRARSLAVALHCCGSNINYERILSTIGHVYPAETAFSWNFEGGNPSLEHVLENTSLRVWGTYPRGLLRDAVDPASAVDLESFLLRHRQWLEEAGHLHRVVIGPDCCPGAFIGEEVPAIGWGVVQRAYQQWLPDAPAAQSSSVVAAVTV